MDVAKRDVETKAQEMKTKTLPDGLLVWGDCLEWMRAQPDNSIDLTLGSPTKIAVLARMRRRRFVGIDIRESQIKLTLKRLEEADNRKGFDLD